MALVADIPLAVQTGLQRREQNQLAPIQQRTAQLGLEQQQQQLGLGRLQKESIQQQIDTRTDDQKNKSLVMSAIRIKGLPDEQKLQGLIENRDRIIAEGGDSSDTDAGIALAQEGRFDELNQGLSQIEELGVRQGIIKAQPQQKLSSIQQKVAAEGIDPNTQAGFDRAREITQGSRTDPSLKPSDQQVLNKASEGQLAAAGFANRVESANVNLDRLEATKGFDPTSIAAAFFEAVPGGNIALSTEQQEYQQSKRDFITAVLRKESGAAIGADEFTNEDKKFFPQIGDKAGVLKQKAAGRRRAFDNLKKQSKDVFNVQFGKSQERVSPGGVKFTVN